MKRCAEPPDSAVTIYIPTLALMAPSIVFVGDVKENFLGDLSS
jgi:hypothetical protein